VGNDPFISILLSRGLVLPEHLARWQVEQPDLPLHRLLIAHSDALSVSAWAETMASLPDAPPFWPPGSCRSLPPEAFSGSWGDALRLGRAVLLRSSPVIYGLVSPFDLDQAEQWLSFLPSHLSRQARLVCPHFFSAAAALVGTIPSKAPATTAPPSLDDWAGLRGFPQSNVTTQDILSHADKQQADVFPHGYFRRAAPVEGTTDNIAVVFRTPTHVWICGPSAGDPLLLEHAVQTLRLTPHPCLVSPLEYARLTSADSAEVSVRTIRPRVAPRWTVPTQDEERIGRSVYSQILEFAILAGASDIHFEPQDEACSVRLRIDGDMVEQPPLEHPVYRAVLRRAKIEGAMQQSVNTTRQDGAGTFTSVSDSTPRELRFSIGIARREFESLVIRINDRSIVPLEDIDMSAMGRKALNWYLNLEGGLFIISGPTGSGKTTTLYACLDTIAKRGGAKLLTIENPVEKLFPAAVQFDLRSGSQFTPTDALETAMRHDPDVVMIGELRERIFVDTAMSIALTGHKVLTTLHANDVYGVLDRLFDSYGVRRSSAANALRLIMAQRLVRRVCPACRQLSLVQASELEDFPDVLVSNPVKAHAPGCPACDFTGFSGRFAISEILAVDDKIAPLIAEGAPVHQIAKVNKNRGGESLGIQAARLALTGEISLSEARLFLPPKSFA
jgi:type II secretory ATPase GspE/PulE/Tfp pilus assembly ATPase PilB-like protein